MQVTAGAARRRPFDLAREHGSIEHKGAEQLLAAGTLCTELGCPRCRVRLGRQSRVRLACGGVVRMISGWPSGASVSQQMPDQPHVRYRIAGGTNLGSVISRISKAMKKLSSSPLTMCVAAAKAAA